MNPHGPGGALLTWTGVAVSGSTRRMPVSGTDKRIDSGELMESLLAQVWAACIGEGGPGRTLRQSATIHHRWWL